jgi:hypothetical protein
MITRTSQRWEVGQKVKVGFLTLKVVGFKATPGDYKPDVYLLENAKGIQYVFTPHYGLEKL